MKTLRSFTACLAVVSCIFASQAQAGVVTNLGGGWQAQVADDSLVSIVVDSIGANYIAIEISKDFTEGPGQGGIFPGLDILFTQIGTETSTVPFIVILDEAVTNLTGTDWTDYHMSLQTNGSAWFSTVDSAGFSMSPFAVSTFSDPGNIFGGDPTKATHLDSVGGVVFNNSSFFPGAGAGELVIGTLPGGSANPVSFVLTEVPTPEPASLALLAIGCTLLRRRTRRA